MNSAILNNSEWSRPPYSDPDPEICGCRLPPDFLAILRISNGLLTKQGIFRVFGTESGQLLPSILEWNAGQWKAAYGKLAEGLVFVAEDIFGDQYGFRLAEGAGGIIKFYCEGGQVEEIGDGAGRFSRALGEPRASGLVDFSLIGAAFTSGLRPGPREHLAFRVPFIVGGDRRIENL